MLLITIFMELRVVAGRSQTRAGSPQAVSWRLCCAVALRRTAWAQHGHGMASVNQTWPHCVNQMGKTHSKPLAARHGIGTACYVWIGLYTTFPHFVPKIAPCICVCVYACTNLRLHACMDSHSPATSQTIWNTRQISKEFLCGRWLYASEGPLLFGLHFPSRIIQHGGHLNFWVGCDNEHHICGVLDIMSDGRILKKFLSSVEVKFLVKGCRS